MVIFFIYATKSLVINYILANVVAL